MDRRHFLTITGAAAAPALAREANWKVLFDGKDLRAWVDLDKRKPASQCWTLADGCIKTVPNPRIREDMVTKESFGDFELEWEWKVAKAGNTGLKYRVQDFVLFRGMKSKPGAKRIEEVWDWELRTRHTKRSDITPEDKVENYTVAFEYQLVDSANNPDARRGPKYSAGALYSMIPAVKDMAKPAGEFNQSRLVLRGMHTEHWLNGEKVMDASLDAPEIRAGLAARHGEDAVITRLLSEQPKRQCPIALQHHNDEAWFRNIRIRKLD